MMTRDHFLSHNRQPHKRVNPTLWAACPKQSNCYFEAHLPGIGGEVLEMVAVKANITRGHEVRQIAAVKLTQGQNLKTIW